MPRLKFKKSPKRAKNDISDQAYQNFLLLNANNKFQNEINILRQICGVPEKGFDGKKEAYEWAGRHENKTNYIRILRNIRRKAKGFTSQYDKLLMDFFLCGKIFAGSLPKKTAFYRKEVEGKCYFDDSHYFIEVFPNTLKEDLEKEFDLFKIRMQSVLPDATKKFQPIQCLERDLLLVELTSNGFNLENDLQEIIKIVDKSFPHQSLKQSQRNYKYINDRISNTKKHIKNIYY